MFKRIVFVVVLSFLFTILYPANVSPLPYGINVHLAKNEILEKIKKAGIKWIRIDINWSVIEQSKGKFYYSEVDRVVNYANSNGLSVLAILGGTPGWANNNKGENFPASNVNNWKNFVKKMVNRYKSKVKYWNIWNEPNNVKFFAQTKDIFLNQIFLPAAKSIKSADPSAFIVGPELSHQHDQGEEWYFWLKYILQNAGNYIDVVSHHIYSNKGVYYIYELLEYGDNFVPSVKEIIEETGHGSKPFWITEIGWNTSSVSEKVQADGYLEMLQKRKAKNYPQKIFFYEIIDDKNPGVLPFGILTVNKREKPSYGVYRDFIAGKYPDLEESDEDDDKNKKCYIEEAVSNSNSKVNSHILSNLRSLKIYLNSFSYSAQKVVKLYYNTSDEFSRIFLSDSRVFKLSLDLLSDIDQFICKNNRIYINKRLDRSIFLKTNLLISLLKHKKTSKSFKELLLWGETQLKLLEANTIEDYLIFHTDREIRAIEK